MQKKYIMVFNCNDNIQVSLNITIYLKLLYVTHIHNVLFVPACLKYIHEFFDSLILLQDTETFLFQVKTGT